MGFMKNVAGAVVLASLGACGENPPEYAMDLTQNEHVRTDNAYNDAVAITSINEALLTSADPLFNAHEEAVSGDNSEVIDDMHGTLADFHYYKENYHIYAFTIAGLEAAGEEYVAPAFFEGHGVFKENYRNDYILMNREMSSWPATLFMHEAAHRMDLHNEGVIAIFDTEGAVGFVPEDVRMVLEEKDWAMLISYLYSFSEKSLYDLQSARGSLEYYQEYSGDPQALVDAWETFDKRYDLGDLYDYDYWHNRTIEDLWTCTPQMDESLALLGLTKEEVSKAFMNEDVFNYVQTEREKIYEIAQELYQEAKTEIDAERSREFQIGMGRRR